MFALKCNYIDTPTYDILSSENAENW